MSFFFLIMHRFIIFLCTMHKLIIYLFTMHKFMFTVHKHAYYEQIHYLNVQYSLCTCLLFRKWLSTSMYDYYTHINNNYYRWIINIFCKNNLLNFEIFWKFASKQTVHGPCIVPNKFVHSGIFFLEHERAYARLLGRTE